MLMAVRTVVATDFRTADKQIRVGAGWNEFRSEHY